MHAFPTSPRLSGLVLIRSSISKVRETWTKRNRRLYHRINSIASILSLDDSARSAYTHIENFSATAPSPYYEKVRLIGTTGVPRGGLRRLCETVPRRHSSRPNRTGAYHMLIHHTRHPCEGLTWPTTCKTLATYKGRSLTPEHWPSGR